MLIAALFITAKTWKQPRYPTVGEQNNTLWYIRTMEYYSALKGNELSRQKRTRRNLKCMLISERSQYEKSTFCIIPTYDIWKT